ncbi:MAG: WG repeat-containing protein [Bacteroidetes bacterium]|nr:WG repeat-containing protein [Bacteroidota bacterium]
MNRISFFSCLLICCFFSSGLFAQKMELTWPYSHQSKFGLVDAEGEIVLEPVYDNISLFSNPYLNDFTLMRFDNKYGIINKKGEEIVPPKYEHMSYDGNGGFVWYYEDYPNMLGLHVFSLESGEVIYTADSLRAREVIGENPFFLTIRHPQNMEAILIDESGKQLLSCGRSESFTAYFTEEDCPMLAAGGRYSRGRILVDCEGTEMSMDAYMEKYQIEDEGIVFEDSAVDFEDAGGNEEADLDNYQAAFPDYELKELISDAYGRKVSIIAKDDKGSYGLLSLSGEILIPFDYHNLHLSFGYIYASRYAYEGVFSPRGKPIIPVEYFRVELVHPEKMYFMVSTHSGYRGYASVYGKVYLPKDIPMK